MDKNIDMGDLMSKTPIEIGKELADKLYPNVDYGDLPANKLINLGKETLKNEGVIINDDNK